MKRIYSRSSLMFSRIHALLGVGSISYLINIYYTMRSVIIQCFFSFPYVFNNTINLFHTTLVIFNFIKSLVKRSEPSFPNSSSKKRTAFLCFPSTTFHCCFLSVCFLLNNPSNNPIVFTVPLSPDQTSPNQPSILHILFWNEVHLLQL